MRWILKHGTKTKSINKIPKLNVIKTKNVHFPNAAIQKVKRRLGRWLRGKQVRSSCEEVRACPSTHRKAGPATCVCNLSTGATRKDEPWDPLDVSSEFSERLCLKYSCGEAIEEEGCC